MVAVQQEEQVIIDVVPASAAAADDDGALRRVPVPPPRSLLSTVGAKLKETLFPDDPFRAVSREPAGRRRALAVARYLLPCLDWLPSYSFAKLRSDLVSGLTIASLAVPQGISYARLAGLDPVIGLYSSFVPALVYAVLGSSRELAVGNTAVTSLLFASMLEPTASSSPAMSYAGLAFTATFFAGAFQAALGVLRLGFLIDFLSHAAIVGFMGGAATVVALQQLRGFLGLPRFTHATDFPSVVRSVVSQSACCWRWQPFLLGACVFVFLQITRYVSKRRPKLFWISAAAPLASIVVSTLFVYLINGEKYSIQTIGPVKKGINPLSVKSLLLSSPHTWLAARTGIITGIISLAEGSAVARSFAMAKNYHVDGNKEMLAFGAMNMAGSITSCYLTAAPFSRSAVNRDAGCRTPASNAVMSVAVAATLVFLTPLFRHTPHAALSAIITSAMLGVVDVPAAARLLHIDRVDFCVCAATFLGVVFRSVDAGLAVAVAVPLVLRVLLAVARPRTAALGRVPGTTAFRRVDQYPSAAAAAAAVLVLRVDSPILFANAGYLRERISRWIDDHEDQIQIQIRAGGGGGGGGESLRLRCVVLDMGAVTSIDSSGTSMLEDLKRSLDKRSLQLALANPGSEVMRKLDKSKVLQIIGDEWIFLTVADASDYAHSNCKIGTDLQTTVLSPDEMV